MKQFLLLLRRWSGHLGLVVLIVIGLATQPHAQSTPVEDPFLPPDASLVAYSIAFALEGHTSPPPPFEPST